MLGVVFAVSKKNNMPVIAQHYDSVAADISLHLEQYCVCLERIHPYQALKINSKKGKDFFTIDQNLPLIGVAGDDVLHETHRNKFSFACHVTAQYLERKPAQKISRKRL